MPRKKPSRQAPTVRLDPTNSWVWQGEQRLQLTPKALAVLHYLIKHPGRIVSKADLLQAVWADTIVSEWALTTCIRELRKALGDQPQSPHYIETVQRRGYRWIAAVAAPVASSKFQVSSQDNARLETRKQKRETLLVGRETELGQIHHWLEKALNGERQLVFITGEAGIGKTTLVEAFLEGVRGQGLGSSSPAPTDPRFLNLDPWIGWGQCIEHYGAGEAYLPVLEAVGQLCRQPEHEALITILERYAPTWLVQLPSLLEVEALEALRRKGAGATKERMLREMAEALEILTADKLLVLVLEDLQWSDPSTLDLLAYVARRRQPARLFVLGTYRPVEVLIRNHPLKTLQQELALHELCVQLPLDYLPRTAVHDYLARRFPGNIFPAEFAAVLQARTGGHPLFLMTLLKVMAERNLLVHSDGQWQLQTGIEEVVSQVPESTRQLILQQFEHLTEAEQRVLETASVAGVEFSVAAVAAGLEAEVEGIEEQCEEIARRGHFLHVRGESTWPDGTIAGRYGFIHALYQEVLYARLAPGRRRRLHQRIGVRAEAGYGERAREIATELAVHFERGQDYPRAVRYLQQAGENAVRRSAHQEALSLLSQGLKILPWLPDTLERAQQELSLQITMGTPLMATKGYGASEVEQVYARARELCQQLEATSHLFPVLRGLWVFYEMRAELQTAHQLEEQLLSLAQSTQDSALLLEAHFAWGHTSLFGGEFTAALDHLEHGIALYNSQQHYSHAFLYGQDPGVFCLALAAWALWFLGYPDRALKRSQEALLLAQELSHPNSLGAALVMTAHVHQYRREVHIVRERAETVLAFASEQGLPSWLAGGAALRGWALTEQGQTEEGIVQIGQSIGAIKAAGADLIWPYFFALQAESYGAVGQCKEGLNTLAEALAVVQKKGERFFEAELYRLRGELTLQQNREQETGNGEQGRSTDPRPLILDPQGEAEACFLKAIDIARRQQAKSWELRAAISLACLWRSQGKPKPAHKMLAKIYGWFTEGFDTKDLQEAKALLEELA